MSRFPFTRSRRRFLGRQLLSLAVIPLAAVLVYASRRAGAEDWSTLDEADPDAATLGYVHDASRVDPAAFPKRSGVDGRDQFCHNCRYYTGEADDDWGGCGIFPGKLVSSAGWCNAWVKRK